MSDTIGEVGTAVETIPETKPIVPVPAEKPPAFKRVCEPVDVELEDGEVTITQRRGYSQTTNRIIISVDQIPMLGKWLEAAQIAARK